MRWIIQNIQAVVALIIALTILRRVFRAQRERTSSRPDAEESERARKIREELQRKMAERRAGGPLNFPPGRKLSPEEAPSPWQSPRPILTPPVMGRMTPRPPRDPVKEEISAPVVTLLDAPAIEAVLARQRQLEEKLAEIRAIDRIETRRSAIAAESATRSGNPAARAAILANLKNPGSLRHAFVLKEVLGAPVAFADER